MQDCIFCKIANHKVPSKIELETDSVIAFYDIKPSADTHILVVPKKHIRTFMDVNDSDKDIISEMFTMARKIISKKKIMNKYRISFNGGSLQIVDHLHMHILGGELKKGYDH